MAGPVPGHMDMLLAAAKLSENLRLAIDNINDEFKQTDVVLVMGANDVINPAARDKRATRYTACLFSLLAPHIQF